VLDNIIAKLSTAMTLTVESKDVSSFLGIQFTRKGDTIELLQTGLINKIMAATGMKDCNPKSTPADPKPLGKEKTGKLLAQEWGYASVVGMLLYLSGNSRPDIAFAVNVTHDPKNSHATTVKRIVKYLQATKDHGLVFKPSMD